MAVIARNLLPTGRRYRLMMGIVFSAIAVVGGALLIAGGLPRGTRLALVVPFYLGTVGFLQYRDHT
jgi:hypothetical protein